MNLHADTIKRLWELHCQLCDGGLSFMQAVEELCNLLFIKITPLEEADWGTLPAAAADEKLTTYQNILHALAALPNPALASLFEEAVPFSRRRGDFSTLVFSLQNLDWTEIRQISAPALFEEWLERCAAENPALTATPALLVNCLTVLLQPEPGEKIFDPASGTGAFLVAADEFTRVLAAEESTFAKAPPTRLLGRERRSFPRRAAGLNASLHQTPIEWVTDMRGFAAQIDVVVGDFSFPGALPKKPADFWKSLQSTLKPGGRAALIVNDEFLYAPRNRAIRGQLLDNSRVHTVLRLPDGIYYGHDKGVQVIFFSAGEPSEEIWFYDLRSGLPWYDSRCTPFSAEVLRDFVRAYGSDPQARETRRDEGENGRFRRFRRADLRQDNLDVCWLPEEGPPDALPALPGLKQKLCGLLNELNNLHDILTQPPLKGGH